MAARTALSESDLHTLLRIAQPDDAATSADEPIPWSVLAGLQRLIGCDAIAFFQFDSARKTLSSVQDLPAIDYTSPAECALEQAFWTHYPDCLQCSYPDDSGDLLSVTSISDFYSQREFRATGMYADYMRPSGIEREILLCLPSPRYRTLRLMLIRGRGADFSDRDRGLLSLLRPHLYETYLASTRHPAPPLTSRQKELLRLVAAGCTNRQIARKLAVAESTVRKHLENIFDRLQVTSRAAAVARVFGSERHSA